MTEVIIVGSGVGGAQTGLELVKKGHQVTILEAGDYPQLGTERRALGFYTGGFFGPGEFSKEGVEFLRANMVGGSSVITIGNGVKCLEKELASLGIDLSKEYMELGKELNVTPCPLEHMGERTRLLMSASENLEYDMKPMPKFVDFNRCDGCGNCALGCMRNAKWTSRNVIGEAYRYGLKMLRNHRVTQVFHKDGSVTGLEVISPEGVKHFDAEVVVLAAGGLGSPVILLNSGVEAGTHLFGDMFIDTFGIINHKEFRPELGMATIVDKFHEKEGFILSPTMEGPLDLLTDRISLKHRIQALRIDQLIGVMAKTKDLANGVIDEKGKISKPVTKVDQAKVEQGFKRSKELLVEAGARSNSVFRSHIRAAHPGGTAGIGRVVDKNLETEINGLYVCDASVLPEAPGMPPVYTIAALAKHFVMNLF